MFRQEIFAEGQQDVVALRKHVCLVVLHMVGSSQFR